MYTAQPGSRLYELEEARRAALDEAGRLGDLLARREAELQEVSARIDGVTPYTEPAALGEALALRGALLQIMPQIDAGRRGRLDEAEALAGQIRNLEQAIQREGEGLAEAERHAEGVPRMAAHLERRRAEYARKMGDWVGVQPERVPEGG